MHLELSHFVENDLTEIGNFIARHKPGRAETFILELIDEIEQVAKDPLIFRLRPEIGFEARVAVHGNYVILFRVV